MKCLLSSAVVLLYNIVAIAECHKDNELDVDVADGRGKGYKFALLSHFLYVAASKIFILKIVYGYLLYALAIKAWSFFLWLTKYLKQEKHYHAYTEHVSYDHDHHHDHGYGEYNFHDYEPYEYQKTGFNPEKHGPYRKPVYDADGSYSIKSS